MTNNDTDGHSGGTLTAWSPFLNLILVHHFGTIVGTKLKDSETGKYFMDLSMIEKLFGRDWKDLEPWNFQI